jgi:hypothetical protein
MNLIEIPFRADMESLILQGKKTATSRNKLYGVNGDFFVIRGRKFTLTVVSNIPLSCVVEHYFKEEGFNSPAAFIKTWEQIHPRKGYDPKQQIWFHEFKEIENG